MTITKIWNDSNNRDGLRPSAERFAAELHLYSGDTEVTGLTPTVTDNGNNTYTVTYLPEYADGSAIIYTVRENSISGYTADKESVRNGEELTNTHAVTPAPTPTSTPSSPAPSPSDPESGKIYTPIHSEYKRPDFSAALCRHVPCLFCSDSDDADKVEKRTVPEIIR